MNKNELLKYLEKTEGYTHLREFPEQGICGLRRFAFTIGLCRGLDEYGYQGRWCYHTQYEAQMALATWDGTGDPPGELIKYKGSDGERSNLFYDH